MKKIIILFSVLMLISSCETTIDLRSEFEKKEKLETVNESKTIADSSNLNNDFGIIEQDGLNYDDTINSEGELIINNGIVNYGDLSINRITKEFIKGNIVSSTDYLNSDLHIHFGINSDNKKSTKILKIINDLSYESKITGLHLYCDNNNFLNSDLDLLSNTKVEFLSLETNCGFKDSSIKGYNQNGLVYFLDNTEYINFLSVGYERPDFFEKNDGKIRVFRGESGEWEQIK